MTLKDYFGRPVLAQPWDGSTPSGRKYTRPDGLYIDADGNIWYTIQDGNGKSAVWCYASRLDAHVHHLQQIIAR